MLWWFSISHMFLVLLIIMVILFFFCLVAFFVLLERKVLGLSQSRFGPQKVSVLGVFQSFADFIKLIGKVDLFISMSGTSYYRGVFYYLGVFYFFCCSLCFIGFFINSFLFNGCFGFSLCWLVVISSLSGYGFLMCGWGSLSKYSLFGAMRASFSSISFEGVLICLTISIGCMFSGYSFNCVLMGDLMSFISLFGLYIISLICFFSECNRSPFDYSESESDLVSGFNTEYYGLSFALLFACEYSLMIFFCWLISFIFFPFILGFMMFIHSFIFIFVRACFPRMRYDFFTLFIWQHVYVFIFMFLCFVL
uniref:NADH dehydrogenase subunit 1 n=1 Tax=Eudiplozoon nipponicum TaxID=116851 RepID=UPI001F128CA7|nr:NADH dehydrogenase subunit 1 [Eudiplozoon nipponicum]UKQ56158.1 NADH dehydrogenase subunit 1 [Eudiplozoon nipponicum]